MADTEVEKQSQHQSVIFQKFKALSAQFWANFFFFCILFTLMGANGVSFLAFYMEEIFEKVR